MKTKPGEVAAEPAVARSKREKFVAMAENRRPNPWEWRDEARQ